MHVDKVDSTGLKTSKTLMQDLGCFVTGRSCVTEQVEIIGGPKNFWLYSQSDGYDLTHPPTPDAPPIYPRIPRIPLETTKCRAAIDPAKIALVVVDLQSYFLSPSLGRPSDSVGMTVVDNLQKYAVPACRKASIPIVWLGWGLTQQGIEEMPPAIVKGFAADTNFEGPRKVGGLGSDIGPVKLEDGSTVDGGRVLMADQWNSEFYGPLAERAEPQDLWINKNRLSGFWGRMGIEDALKFRGIRTLPFSGCNTDQCVGGSLQDAFTKRWDCLLLSDGCGTTSPEFARRCIEFNCEEGWGLC